MTDSTENGPLPVSNDRLKQTQFELASLEYEARGGGRDAYNRKSLLSLLIVVQHEIERVLVLSSIVACTANALDAGVANIKPRALIRYFPRESSQLTLSGLRLNKWFAELDVRSLIDEFNELHAQAKEETIAFTATGFSELRRDETGRSALALKWQKACAVGHKLLIGIDRQLAGFEIQGAANEVSQLLGLLEDVASGRWPLIDDNGDVAMPPWG